MCGMEIIYIIVKMQIQNLTAQYEKQYSKSKIDIQCDASRTNALNE